VRAKAKLMRWSCLFVAVVQWACGSAPPPMPAELIRTRRLPPQLPDSTGWGVHVLVMAQDASGSLWVGTYGQGIYVWRENNPPAPATRGRQGQQRGQAQAAPPRGTGTQPQRQWEHIGPRANDSTSLSWPFINSIAFTASGHIWYGTVGNGFGVSTDSGRTWRNWTGDQLGKEWQYVALNGIRTQGDTVYIATADGLRITRDAGRSWVCVQAEGGTSSPDSRDGCDQRLRVLPSSYLLTLAVDSARQIWAGHLSGLSLSSDGGRSWRTLTDADGVPRTRIRSVATNDDSTIWVASEKTIYVDSAGKAKFREAVVRPPGWRGLPGPPRGLFGSPAEAPPIIATSYGMITGDALGPWHVQFLPAADAYRPAGDIWSVTWWGPPLWPIGGSSAGLNLVLAGSFVRPPGLVNAPRSPMPADPAHAWFRRPILDTEGNPYIDGTYRYGSTMGGNFQQHQGVEFNNPQGTPVHAVGDGVVVFAGTAEQGSNTIAILHDRRWEDRHVFSTYYHNTALEVRHGQRVSAGDLIARVGSTGRATNHHLHLEIHVAPTADSAQIVNPAERFPPFTVNPELWLEPLPGTGIVAGRVQNAAGQPVRGARVYGLVWPYPSETPFSFAETYGDRARPDPAHGEHFAVGDVPAGDYSLGVDIDGVRVWRRVRVEAGKLTFVVFSP
jgi:hypothetical protein